MADGASPNGPSLLLLPPPPTPATSHALKAAYHPSITAAISELSALNLADSAVLEVVVPCPGLVDQLQEPRSQLFEGVQHLLAGVYSLICLICAQKAIPADSAGGVDYRVVLLAHDDKEHLQDEEPPLRRLTSSGPIIDLPTFALTRRKWRYIFSVDGEEGEGMFRNYINLASRINPPVEGNIQRVTGGISLVASRFSDHKHKAAVTHSVVAVGGTFDHLHAGHKLLLTSTALLLQPSSGSVRKPGRMIVGITGDELLKNKKFAEYLFSWKKRQEDVIEFLTTILYFAPPGKSEVETLSFDEPVANGRAIHTTFKNAGITIECVEIQDPFGPTITDQSVSALVVSGETRSGGAAVNIKRQEKGWKTLELFEVDVLDALGDEELVASTESFAAKISSTAIRKSMFERETK